MVNPTPTTPAAKGKKPADATTTTPTSLRRSQRQKSPHSSSTGKLPPAAPKLAVVPTLTELSWTLRRNYGVITDSVTLLGSQRKNRDITDITLRSADILSST